MVYKKGNIPWVKGRKTGIVPKTAFKIGHTPWNKGLKGRQPWMNINGLYKGIGEHPNWRGGVSFIYKTERQILMNRSKYKIWRELVFIRDNWTCQDCGLIGIYLNAHHIKTWNNYPELRFDVDNGLTLCKSCHLNLHKQIKLKLQKVEVN